MKRLGSKKDALTITLNVMINRRDRQIKDQWAENFTTLESQTFRIIKVL